MRDLQLQAIRIPRRSRDISTKLEDDASKFGVPSHYVDVSAACRLLRQFAKIGIKDDDSTLFLRE